MAYQPSGGGTYRLQSSIGSTDTTITLSSFLEPISGTAYTMTNLGSVIMYATLEPQSATRSEFISFTGITQNADGTATLTGVTRGLSRSTPYTSSTTFKLTHAGQSIFILSDSPEHFNEYAIKRNDETISGTYSFSSVPNASADPVAGNDLARRSWVLSVVNGGAVTSSNLVVTATAGETVAAGNLVYLKAADGRWWKTDADDATTINNVILGIAQGSGTAGNAVSGGVLISGLDTNQSGLAAGTTYYASNTAGAIASSAGTISKIVGVGRTSTNLYFNPYFGELPVGKEKAAMAGSNGTPSSTNKFLTQQALYGGSTDQTQTTQDTSTAAGEADATTKHNLLAQSFIAGVGITRGSTFYKAANTGSFTGTVTVSLQSDSAGSPDGVNLASTTISNAAWLLIPTGTFDAVFSAEYATVVGTTYWLVITCSTSDNSNHPNFGANTAGGYASGSSKFKNVTDGWTANGVLDLYFATLPGIKSVIPKTDSNGYVPSVMLPYSYVELNNTQTAVSNSNTLTTVYTRVLPAGFFTATSGFKIKVFMNDVTLTTESIAVTITLNGTTVATITKFSGGGSSIAASGFFECICVNNGSVTNSQKSALYFQVYSSSDTVVTFSGSGSVAVATSAVDTSVTCILQAKVQMSASTSCSFSADSVLLEKIG